jgi:hypothetical protein
MCGAATANSFTTTNLLCG